MSQQPPQKLTDEEIKAAARSGGTSRPGVVSVSGVEAARLDQRIAEKRSGVSTGSTASMNSSDGESAESDNSNIESNKAPPAALGRLEQDLQAKQRGRGNGTAATQPGAVSSGGGSNTTTARAELSGLEADVAAKNRARAPASAAATMPGAAQTELSSLEADVAAKNRARAPPAVASRPGAVASAESLDQKVAAKMLSSGQPADQLQQLEASITGKMRTGAPATMPGATPGLAQFEDEVTAKTGRAVTEISRLDDRIAAKNAMHTSTATASNTPRRLQDAEDEVLKKKSVPAQTKHDDVPPPEQYASGKEDDMEHRHQEGLMASAGDTLRGANATTDLEYGVYGGPGENGLAVAFAVEEDDDDMFIPSAVEYDPDAKPPMYRNRRFRLYAFLAIIVVVVVTIGAAVGITLSNKKEIPQIPYRETLGIRENIERLVGSDVLDDHTSPYRKALDWITYDDPKAVTPDDSTFEQRYYAAAFYFATSVKHPWSGGCNPPEGTEPDHCIYQRLVSLNPIEYTFLPWTRWLSAQNECNWAGVGCDENGQFRSIELSGINMTGSFPDISGFPFLQSFGLFYSELSGPLPDNVGEMKHLNNLEIQGHAFTGTIPDSWYNSRSLYRINLNENQLSGPLKPEIRNMRDVKGLFLSGNLLTGQLPDELSQMPSLTFLRLDRNKFTGTIPTTLGTMRGLAEIWFQENELTGTIPTELGRLSTMEDVSIQTNKLTGPIPEELFNMTGLFRFRASENRLTGTISPLISKWQTMDTFHVDSNLLKGNVPTEMGLLTNLKWVRISGNDLVGSVPDEVCALELLKELEADCGAPYNGVPELACRSNCCTTCCDTDGENCYPIIGNEPK